VVSVAAYTLPLALPLETHIILPIDAFLITLASLTYVMLSVVTPNQCQMLAQRRPAIRHSALILCIVATVVGIAAIGVLLHSQTGEVRWLRTLHMAGSTLALLFGWIAAQMTFAIQS
jgi:uncharacterized membrane protein